MIRAIEAPISAGELIDKITILEVKVERLIDRSKIDNAQAELDLLHARRTRAIPESPELARLTAELAAVNRRIWDLEDTIRDCERQRDFGVNFVAVARSIYRANDERAVIKRRINFALGSELVEEKSYAAY